MFIFLFMFLHIHILSPFFCSLHPGLLTHGKVVLHFVVKPTG